MAQAEAIRGEVDQGEAGVGVITLLLEHPEHPIVRIEGVLVYFDTGAPQSLIPGPNAPWTRKLGISAPPISGLTSMAFERTRNTLTRLTGGLRIDALVGMDLINEHGLAYDLSAGQIGWGISHLETGDLITLRSELVLGLPVIEMELAGRQLRVILDTGCHTDGYVLDLPKTLPEAGVIRDESPIFGPFESAARYAEASVWAKNGSKINLRRGRFGEAPPALEFALTSIGVDGVVGVPILQQTGSILFEQNSVLLSQRQG